MNKSELFALLAKQQLNVPEKKLANMAKHVVEYLCTALVKGERIEIRDFGNFELHYHPPRDAHNPKTKVRLMTEGKYIPHFKAGKGLRQRINQARDKGVVIVDN